MLKKHPKLQSMLTKTFRKVASKGEKIPLPSKTCDPGRQTHCHFHLHAPAAAPQAVSEPALPLTQRPEDTPPTGRPMLMDQKKLASLQATHNIERKIDKAAKVPWSLHQSLSNGYGFP